MCNAELSTSNQISSLKNLDDLLKCGICYEYLKTSLITPCSHNYCSYCIRKSLMYRTQCPSCFEETTESQLRNNRVLDEVIVIFSSLKDTVLKCLSNPKNARRNIFENLSINEQHRKEESEIKSPASQHVVVEHFPETTPNVVPPSTSNTNGSRTPGTPKKDVRIPSMFSPRKQKVTSTITNSEVPKVSCPVCSVEIPERNINIHLDACLKRCQEKRATKHEKRKPLPKLVYTLIKEKELRKKLGDIGLSTLGDRVMLVNRHKRYTLLYNSECDSLNPRTVSEIIKQLKKEEEEEKKVTTQIAPVVKLNVDRKADPKVNEEAQRHYLQEHKSSFQNLIEAIRKNKQSKKNEEKDNMKDETKSESSPQVITIDDASLSLVPSEPELNIRQKSKSKRKRIVSESDDSSGTDPSVPVVSHHVKVEASVHRSDVKESEKVVGKQVDKFDDNGKSVVRKELTGLEEISDGVSKRDSIRKQESTPQREASSKPSTSASSPVLGTRTRLNFTPKINQVIACEKGLSPDMFGEEVTSPKGEEKGLKNFGDSDSDSSNDSISLMVYNGPESLSQSTPVKDASPSPSMGTPSLATDHSNSNSGMCSFSLGIDSLLQETEDFEASPIRRSRRRKQMPEVLEFTPRSLRKRKK